MAWVAVNFCKVVEPDTNKSPVELMVVEAVPPIASEEPVKELAKLLVEVAEVEVELAAKNEPVASTVKRAVPAAFKNLKKLPTKPVEEEATIKLPVVPVAFTANNAERSEVVVEPMITETVVVGARKLVLDISKVLP